MLTVILEAIAEVRQEHSKQLSTYKRDSQHRHSAPSYLRNQYRILLGELSSHRNLGL